MQVRCGLSERNLDLLSPAAAHCALAECTRGGHPRSATRVQAMVEQRKRYRGKGKGTGRYKAVSTLAKIQSIYKVHILIKISTGIVDYVL